MTRNGWLGIGAVLLAAGAGAWWFWPGESVALRGAQEYQVLDRARLYLGSAYAIRTPAVVRADAAYAQIPEYRRIAAEGLTPDGPQYHLLLKTASDKFLAALRPIAAAHGHDTVAEVGAIRVVNPGSPVPPDLTAEVVAALGR